MRRFISFFTLAFVVNIISWLFIYYKIKPSLETIPLHYNIFYGADLVGKGYKLYLLPAIGIVLTIVNMIFSRLTAAIDRFTGKTLAVVSLIVAVIIFVALAFLKTLIQV